MDYPFRPAMENWQLFALGALVTVEVSLTTLVLSLAVATPLTFLRVAPWRPGQALAGAYVQVFRNVPPLVIVFFFYFALPRIGIVLSGFLSGVLALTVYHAAFVAEILRAGIEAVGRGQFEAARALGMSYRQCMRHVVLPQGLGVIVPPLGNLAISLTKTTALVAAIAVADITYQAQVVDARTFRTLEVFGFAGAVYLVLVLILGRATHLLERRLTLYRGDPA